MGSIRKRSDTGFLFFDFRYRSVRCREQTTLADSTANRRRMQQVLDRVEAEIILGTFDYAKYFPQSAMLAKLSALPTAQPVSSASSAVPLLKDFVEVWWAESEVRWRMGTRDSFRWTIDKHLIPRFGEQRLNEIKREEVLLFRAELAKRPGRGENEVLSPKTVNHVLGMLRMILDEGAGRYNFQNPCTRIKRLKVPRKDIEPFSLPQVKGVLDEVRSDFRNYYTVRFFTGMRTGEIHGLKWKNIDFERKQILVRETWLRGRTEYTKNDGSQREIDMSALVLSALKAQESRRKDRSEYVFCDRLGGPLDAKNVANRVWFPILRHLGLKKRRPYQCRHTCATLWLAAGENPVWIARQLGHTTTEMLFRVYSRFVPNLTRRDGSAFDRLVTNAMLQEPTHEST